MRLWHAILGGLGVLGCGATALAGSALPVGGARLQELIRACGGHVVIGSVDATPQTAAPILGTRCVFGTLTLHGEGVLRLPALERVYGRLVVADTGLARVELPALDELWLGAEVAGNARLEEVAAPRLGSINARAAIRGNARLARLAWGALGAVNGGLEVADNPELRAIDLGALGSVNGRLLVTDNPALTELRLDALGSLHGTLVVAGNRRLPTCAVEAALAGLQPRPGRTVVVAGNGPC